MPLYKARWDDISKSKAGPGAVGKIFSGLRGKARMRDAMNKGLKAQKHGVFEKANLSRMTVESKLGDGLGQHVRVAVGSVEGFK